MAKRKQKISVIVCIGVELCAVLFLCGQRPDSRLWLFHSRFFPSKGRQLLFVKILGWNYQNHPARDGDWARVNPERLKKGENPSFSNAAEINSTFHKTFSSSYISFRYECWVGKHIWRHSLPFLFIFAWPAYCRCVGVCWSVCDVREAQEKRLMWDLLFRSLFRHENHPRIICIL